MLILKSSIKVDGFDIACFSEKDPAKLPWAKLNIDIVFECTGLFTSKDKAEQHIQAGAKRVLISAPGQNVDKTIVFGVNHETLTNEDRIISNASCTTNCLAPLAKIIHEEYKILNGLEYLSKISQVNVIPSRRTPHQFIKNFISLILYFI